ncbi:hypothetical protein LOD99_10617 [Oopsacas minuta]|uniref:C2H2-type domain-containing protein n=1 Tax=Oopsacas minuta TaxID=111878 RepID=A0AAV7KFF1_9METZ|nr:hypothetical protein LOD99_10617 [Oopsacas minuta]
MPLADTSNSTVSRVLCEICFQYKNAKKYKRHLRYHVKQKKISSKQLGEIIFQTRYSRRDYGNVVNSIVTGSRCTINGCNNVVKDLPTHLTRFHGLKSTDVAYDKVLKNCESIQRRVFFNQNNLKFNPVIDINDKVTLSSKLLDVIEEKSTENCEIDVGEVDGMEKSDLNDDPFEFPEGADSNDEILEDNPIFIPKNINKTISQHFLNSIYSFRDHSLTICGGSRSLQFRMMDYRNIIFIFNALGEKSFFNSSKLNHHISRELELGKSQSTLYSRLLPISRIWESISTKDSELINGLSECSSALTNIDVRDTVQNCDSDSTQSLLSLHGDDSEYLTNTSNHTSTPLKDLYSRTIEVTQSHNSITRDFHCSDKDLLPTTTQLEDFVPIIPEMESTNLSSSRVSNSPLSESLIFPDFSLETNTVITAGPIPTHCSSDYHSYSCESSDSAFNLSIESSVHESTSLKCEHNLNKIDMGIKMKPFHLCLNRVIISVKKNRRNPYSKMELRKAHPRSIFRNQNDENI